MSGSKGLPWGAMGMLTVAAWLMAGPWALVLYAMFGGAFALTHFTSRQWAKKEPKKTRATNLLMSPFTMGERVRNRRKAPWWAWPLTFVWDLLVLVALGISWFFSGLFLSPRRKSSAPTQARKQQQPSPPKKTSTGKKEKEMPQVKLKTAQGKSNTTQGSASHGKKNGRSHGANSGKKTTTKGTSKAMVAESLDELVRHFAAIKTLGTSGFNPGKEVNHLTSETREAAAAGHAKALALLKHLNEAPTSSASGEYKRFTSS